jgi:hypothetical protein
MAGKAKYAEKMAKHLGTPVDAACGVAKPGSTMAGAMTIGVGGAVGAVAATAASSRAGGAVGSDIAITKNCILALEPESFDFVGIDLLLGRPKGEPFAHVAYADVAEVTLTKAKITMRVDVALNDGRAFSFESKRMGQNKPNLEVLELLQQRCAS